MKLWRSDESKKPLCFSGKETINLGRNEKIEGLGLEVVNGKEVTKKIRVSLTRVIYTASWP